MGARLQTYEQVQQATFDELREAKNLSDTQAQEISARAEELDHARELAESYAPAVEDERPVHVGMLETATQDQVEDDVLEHGAGRGGPRRDDLP